jgi:hypothetical protein
VIVLLNIADACRISFQNHNVADHRLDSPAWLMRRDAHHVSPGCSQARIAKIKEWMFRDSSSYFARPFRVALPDGNFVRFDSELTKSWRYSDAQQQWLSSEHCAEFNTL